MTTLDAIRAEIVARRDRAQRVVEREAAERDRADAELLAHDRAVAAMNGTAGARRNIAALVLAQLTAEGQPADALAKAVDAQPRQVKEAIGRLLGEGKIAETPTGWVRVGGLAL